MSDFRGANTFLFKKENISFNFGSGPVDFDQTVGGFGNRRSEETGIKFHVVVHFR